jgi:hypothetical protein
MLSLTRILNLEPSANIDPAAGVPRPEPSGLGASAASDQRAYSGHPGAKNVPGRGDRGPGMFASRVDVIEPGNTT